MSFFCRPVNDDVFYFDREELESLAGEQAVRLGLACFRENRVLEIDQDGDRLWAVVEDEEVSSLPLDVQIEQTPDGRLLFSCECEACDGAVCAHQAAVVFVYADQCQENEQFHSAVDSAIADRIKRGKSEVRVESESGEPWFGGWRAFSVDAPFARQYRVIIRSLNTRTNYCSCPDFAGNQLGTCKHIEAVLHKIGKHEEHEIFRQQAAPFPYVYLSWDHEQAPAVCVHRCAEMEEEAGRLLNDFFSADGTFKGRLPDDFFRFVELVDQRGDIHVGEDAIKHVGHLAETAAHTLRSTQIRHQIKGSRGILPGIKAKLYPYQVQGVGFLAGTGRCLLADDMGLGKTIQSIAAAVWLKTHENVENILIICPASLKQQWAREIEKFTDLYSQVIGGPPDKRCGQYRRQATFHIVNYELVLRDLSVINEVLHPDLIIMDEAQRVKNWRTKIAAAVKLIPSRYAFVLTGTPLENRLEELYSLMQVVDPRVLGPLWRYMIDFHVTDERGKVLGYRNLSRLRTRLSSVMLRRDRSLVSDQLPERITQRLDVGMTPKQREIHDDGMQRAGQLANIAKKRPLTPTESNRLMAALQQARMACNSAGLVDKETEESPKIDELESLLDEMCLQAGRKVVVFSQWELMTRMVEKRLRRMGLGYVRLHGGVPTAKRGELMDRFRDDDGVQVFISTDAGGVGLNLQSGSALVNLDVPWNPAVLEQRNGRIHRLGQKQKVQIITMVAANSYEEQVLALVGTKRELFDNVVNEDAVEDVVGVSKKLLETLVEDLAETKEVPKPAVEPVDMPLEEQVQATRLDTSGVGSQCIPDSEAIRGCIEALQEHFGSRLERILGSRGSLIGVVDTVDAAAEELAVELSATIPVALIDLTTLNGLNRLGAASPLANVETWYDNTLQQEAGGQSRMAVLAGEKFEAAQVLVESNMAGGAMDLLLSSLLAKAADLGGLGKPLDSAEAGVWLYSEAVPNGMLSQEEGGLIMRTVGLHQAASVPEQLVVSLLEECRGFVYGD